MLQRAVVQPQSHQELMAAVSIGDFALVQHLFRADRDIINQQDRVGMTPLMLSAQNGKIEEVEFFLLKGASNAYVNSEGKSALDLALDKGFLRIARILHEHDKERLAMALSHLIASVGLKGSSRFKLLINNNMNLINEPDKKNRTLLMYAVASKNEEVFTWLISHGAELERKDSKKDTALLHAARHGNQNAVEVLLQNGAKHDVVNSAGQSALDLAEKHGHITIANMLRNPIPLIPLAVAVPLLLSTAEALTSSQKILHPLLVRKN